MKKNGLRAQLLRSGIGSMAIKLGGLCLSLAVAIMLARVLGPEEYGVYSYVLALVSLMAM